MGAGIVTMFLLIVIARTWRDSDAHGRRIAWCILLLLAGQVALGVSNVRLGLPLPVAVMHNGVGGLLLLSLLTLFRHARPPRRASD
jgi:cytochrome c oxidase assembly protein subunit 15